MSRQHVWPQWLGEYLPRDDAVNHQMTKSADFWMPTEHRDERSPRLVSGAASSRKLRIVCKECNERWMSQTEQRAKPLFIEMDTLIHPELAADEQALLARWADLLSMVWELGTQTTAATSSDQRLGFSTSEVPVPNTKVWLGTFEDVPGPLRHRYYPFTVEGNDVATMRLSSIVVGRVIFYVVGGANEEQTASEGLNVDDTPMSEYLAQIWPVKAQRVAWPLKPMSYRQYFVLSETPFWEIGVKTAYGLTKVPSLITPEEWCAIEPTETYRWINGVGVV